MARFVSLLVLFLLPGPALQAQAPPQPALEPGVTLQSYRQARAVLDRAVAAHGGEAAIRGIEDVTVAFKGTIAEFNLGPRPNVPDPRPVEGRVVLNFREGWDLYERNDLGDGTGVRSFLRGSEGVRHLFPQSPPVRLPDATVRNIHDQLQRRDPCLLLRAALARHLTLRWLGRRAVDGAEQDVIAFTQEHGAAVSLYVAADTHLVSKSELLSYNTIHGDTVEEVRFADYRDVQGLKMPFARRMFEAGLPVRDKVHTAVLVNTRPAAPQIEIPPAAPAPAPAAQAASAPAEEDPLQVVELAPGVFHLKGLGDGTYHSLFVAFDDHVLVVEAPVQSDVTEKAIERIKATVPGKPIRYVVPTHHHHDHLAGIRPYIAEGATVVTTPGNREIVAAAAAARREAFNGDRLTRSPRPPAIEVIAGKKRVFEDAHRRLELHDVGPHPHAEEIVVAWLPKEGILFQGDLFSEASDQQHPVPREHVAAFLKSVRQHGWKVRTVVGTHGGAATLAQVEAAAKQDRPAR